MELLPSTTTALPPAVLPTADKAFKTLQAVLALKGWTLHHLDAAHGCQRFLASRWGMTRELSDLAAVESFATSIGAPV
ncbi:MAG: hypothetical protein Q7U99_08730 [Rubrivivax sp.]|nr:hypothetical protein [Rubrivivax sp.]MDP3225117.1 hypothetical protein [Rubrivivax sp.]